MQDIISKIKKDIVLKRQKFAIQNDEGALLRIHPLEFQTTIIQTFCIQKIAPGSTWYFILPSEYVAHYVAMRPDGSLYMTTDRDVAPVQLIQPILDVKQWS